MFRIHRGKLMPKKGRLEAASLAPKRCRKRDSNPRHADYDRAAGICAPGDESLALLDGPGTAHASGSLQGAAVVLLGDTQLGTVVFQHAPSTGTRSVLTAGPSDSALKRPWTQRSESADLPLRSGRHTRVGAPRNGAAGAQGCGQGDPPGVSTTQDRHCGPRCIRVYLRQRRGVPGSWQDGRLVHLGR